jgi:hypothetical protein
MPPSPAGGTVLYRSGRGISRGALRLDGFVIDHQIDGRPLARPSAPRREAPAMPRYFFNTRIGDDTIPDVEGEELRDADHAWEVAKAMIVDLLEEQGEYPNILTAALVVTDQKGEVVLEFPFAEALTATDETPTTRH